MAVIRYHEYRGEPWEDLDLAELMSELSDFFLESGFHGLDEWDGSLGALHDAILDALIRRGLLSTEDISSLLSDATALERFLDQLVGRMTREGYLARDEETPFHDPTRRRPLGRPADLRLTDKGVDFLGYRAFRDLVGSLGRASFGRHDSRDLTTGIEASGASKPYEFGDTLNLDVSGTLRQALVRHGLTMPVDLDHDDLLTRQSEYESSCATVLLLDCSHSMILYGEDRFTPAKKVALALTHLIHSQYPGDSLRLVLFHDTAEEIPLSRLARTYVGPYHTNTREGLRLARRILARERGDLKQIIMITDGKPSSLTLPDGSIYTNAWGLDPRIVALTLKEVAQCRREGILINTFMLARDGDLQAFVRRVTAIAHGKAYFTSPYTLGRFVLMDYLKKKTEILH